MIIPDHIKQLISGHLSGTLKPDEWSTLKVWVDESSVHKEYFNEIRNTWILAGKDAQNNKETEKNLVELASQISQYNRRGRRSFWTWQRVAASWIVIVIGSGALGWWTHQDHLTETQPAVSALTTIQARMGSQSTVDLPDGSRVWLNGGSQLSYDHAYDIHDREVQLTGEGCFEVAINPEKPFVVKAGNLSIKAYGTTFNVKAYPEDKVIITTLVKGKVTIVGKDENDKTFSYEMRPNENFTYKTERQTQKESQPSPVQEQTVAAREYVSDPVVIENNVKTELYTSWKDDLWVIEKQKLGVLSKDFERRYNVRIVFASENVTKYHFSGTIQRETIEQVMKILRRTIPLTYSFDRNLITIDEDPTLLKEFHSKNK